MNDLIELLSQAVTQIVEVQDSSQFLRWMQEEVPDQFPAIFAPMADPHGERALATSLGYSIWNATPLPRNGYQPAPLPRPREDRPCPCGSGVDHRRCCAYLPAFPAVDPDEIWAILVELLPTAELEPLARDRTLPVHLMGPLARRLLERGATGRVVRLLEPLFERLEGLDERHEDAIDGLAEAYERLGHLRKRETFLERFETSGNPSLRSAARQCRAMARADEGRLDESWRLFLEAQQDAPDHPGLPGLEITLLMAEDEPERAAHRARFWIARLRRQGWSEELEPIPFLVEVARDPVAALIALSNAEKPEHARALMELVERSLEQPVLAYGARLLEQTRSQAGEQYLELEAPRLIHELEESWRLVWDGAARFPGAPGQGADLLPGSRDLQDPWRPERAERWLAFLAEHPEAFDSFVILRDLVRAADHLTSETPWGDRALVGPLLQRAEAILALSLCGRCRPQLPWAARGNRALWGLLLEELWYLERRGRREGARAHLERLLDLDHEDCHGLRALLGLRYLEDGTDELFLALAGTWPRDDHAEMVYGRVIALYRLGRQGEARRALAQALEHQPRIADLILAKHPKRPSRQSLSSLTLGSEGQAWLYREASLCTWRSVPGLLPWLAEEMARWHRAE